MGGKTVPSDEVVVIGMPGTLVPQTVVYLSSVPKFGYTGSCSGETATVADWPRRRTTERGLDSWLLQ